MANDRLMEESPRLYKCILGLRFLIHTYWVSMIVFLILLLPVYAILDNTRDYKDFIFWAICLSLGVALILLVIAIIRISLQLCINFLEVSIKNNKLFLGLAYSILLSSALIQIVIYPGMIALVVPFIEGSM